MKKLLPIILILTLSGCAGLRITNLGAEAQSIEALTKGAAKEPKGSYNSLTVWCFLMKCIEVSK